MLLAVALVASIFAAASAQNLVANCDGAQQVPPVTTTGTAVWTGTITGDVLEYNVVITGLTSPIDPIGAHIHSGAVGEN